MTETSENSSGFRSELRGHVLLLTLDDVAHRNALSRSIVRGFVDTIIRSRSQGARVIVIAAAGSVFCAGANVNDLAGGWMAANDPETDPVTLFQTLAEERRLVIAAVNGPTLGGGVELTLSCDVVFAEQDAFFCLPEIGLGVVPNTALARLSGIVGPRKALEMIVSRRRVKAAEAAEIGLATQLVSSGEALSLALDFAEKIAVEVSPGALRVSKEYINKYESTDWKGVRVSPTEVPHEEWQEGIRAFSERRRPDFDRFW
ncbi:enoyl-CoA hydratase/isomerase family protein [Allomesorhizobium camelthorni]|uniref:Enoyl-CoA hydratase/isomerase family protein n=1 Tax=Allomesorhizobium camelthorni TaxID=475069 RepID=A0A6G4WFB8_9HYPH|nr:enoyl-CoA hydratase/isomerase family protein [Mesorhizobium camelthorni]NGO53451.1 enoyl-CoA hydratase/isomerase family protein [Mesorhizobium camelthorni]